MGEGVQDSAFLPAETSFLADIPSRDEPSFRLLLVLKEKKE